MNSTARTAYLDASITTASPARLLVMLCERLVLDVRRGLDAQLAGQVPDANGHLLHAQDVVLELRSSLRTETWSGGPQLAALYDYLHGELVRANVGKEPERTRACLGLVEQLCETWREAAMAAATVAAPAR
jgi:flagellar protein FliS